MSSLPDIDNMSEHSDFIQTSRGEGETTISWLVPSLNGGMYDLYTRVLLALAAFSVAGSIVVWHWLPHRHGDSDLLWIGLGYAGVNIVWAAAFHFGKRPDLAAHLVLSGENLTYFPGRHQDNKMAVLPWKSFREPVETILPKSKVGFLNIELVRGKSRAMDTHCLTIFHSSQPVLRLGGSLSERDLLWLQNVIQEWKTQVPAMPTGPVLHRD